MTHDDNVAHSKFGHAIREDGGSVEVFTRILVGDITFSKEDTRERGEDSSFGSSGVAAPKEKKVGMLAVGSQLPEEVGPVGFRDALAESFVSFLEGEQLRVVIGGVGQSANAATTVISPGEKSGGSEDRRVECREDSVKYKRLGEHVEDCHLADGKMGEGAGRGWPRGNPGRCRTVKDV